MDKSGSWTPKISVVIPHHGGLIPKKTLDSLYHQTLLPLEIIVASDGGLEPYIALFVKPVIHLLNIVNNVSVKRNAGALQAKGELVAFTDPDCVPDADWLEKSANYFEDDSVVAVEGLVYSNDAKQNLAPRFQPGTYMTANMIYRKSLFNRIKFDPVMGKPPPHGEDTDFGYRARVFGKIVTAKDVRVYHEPKFMPFRRLVEQYILTRSKHVPLSRKWGSEFRNVVKSEEKQHPLYLVALLYGSILYRSPPPISFGFTHISFARMFSERKRLS